jgi:hypothetical protein
MLSEPVPKRRRPLLKTYAGRGVGEGVREGEAPGDSDAVGERVPVEESVPVWLSVVLDEGVLLGVTDDEGVPVWLPEPVALLLPVPVALLVALDEGVPVRLAVPVGLPVTLGRGEYTKPLDALTNSDEMAPISDKGPAP